MSIKIKALCVFLFVSHILLSQGYHIDNYDVKMELNQDGSLDITENIIVDFEERRQGIIRDIPYIYFWEGKRIKVKISNIAVPGYKMKVSNKGSEKSIRIGSRGKFLEGIQEYSISYRVKGHIAAYDDFLEFYWNPIPEDWDTQIESYSYELKLPTEVDLKFEDYKILSGHVDSIENSATIQYQNSKISGRGTIPLQAKQGVTLAVKLPKDYVPADLISQSAIKSQSNRKPINNSPWTWLTSLLGILAIAFGWKKIDRNSNDDFQINPQHYPPDSMSAAQVGYFIDHKANTRDIMALIPQWGAEGLIRLDKIEEDTQISKIGAFPQELPDYEHTLYNGIFKDGDVVLLNDLKYKIATALYQSQTQLSAEYKKSDLYDDDSKYYFHSWRTIFTGLIFIAAGILSLIFWQAIVIAVTFVLIAFALFIIYFTEPKYSQVGLDIKNKLLGLEDFLKNHDGSDYPNLMKKDPKYFDKIFPYAVAFGIDINFLKGFGDHVEYSPIWYGNNNSLSKGIVLGNSMKDFSENFNIKEITSVFNTVKSSNTGGSGSGGGFSSGGSVGGGFGGGGGSSW